MEIITYSLLASEEDSRPYYRQISVFTDVVLSEADRRCSKVIGGFDQYVRDTQSLHVRTRPEYVLDLLVLGVLWREYGVEALGLRKLPQQVLSGLAGLRRAKAYLKPLTDFLRGALGSFFLKPSDLSSSNIPEASLPNLDRLISWLSATGSFVEEVKRLNVWRDYLASLKPKEAISMIKAAIEFARWFEQQSLESLGRYTENVDQFLMEKHPKYRWREDAILCGRGRVEYHLCMVGNEILNRVFREAFMAAERKVVLLPPCMSAPAKSCKAQPTALGASCAGCTPNCRVHQVTKIGEKHGFAVYLLPDELSVFSSGGSLPTGDGQAGIIGVSCVLTNVTGGWECREIGVPAQGILLDYCGCPWHWHERGFPTDFNLKHFLEVMHISHPVKEFME